MPELLLVILLGLIAGAIASYFMGKENPWWVDVLLGIIGAVVGSWLFSFLGIGTGGDIIWQLIVAVAGAVVVIWLGRMLGLKV